VKRGAVVDTKRRNDWPLATETWSAYPSMARAEPIADVATAHAVVPGLAFSAVTSNDPACLVVVRGDDAGCGTASGEQPPTSAKSRAKSSAVALGCLPRRSASRVPPFMAVHALPRLE
jgi:hypothetical protein